MASGSCNRCRERLHKKIRLGLKFKKINCVELLSQITIYRVVIVRIELQNSRIQKFTETVQRLII